MALSPPTAINFTTSLSGLTTSTSSSQASYTLSPAPHLSGPCPPLTQSLSVAVESCGALESLAISGGSPSVKTEALWKDLAAHPSAFFLIKNDTSTLHECRSYEPHPEDILKKLADSPLKIFKEKAFNDPVLQTIAVPTCQGLMLQASYYEKKYGTPIIVAGSEASIQSALSGLCLDPSVQTYGIIATWGHDTILHVTPYIYHKTSSGKIQILDLDAVGNPVPKAQFALMALKDSCPYLEILKVNGVRQADGFSCRTDAITILKDALIDLQATKIDDLKTFLEAEPATAFEFLHSGYFDLPAKWSKGVQITSCLKKDLAVKVAGAKTYSVLDHRERFTSKIEKLINYHVLDPKNKEPKSLISTFHEHVTINTFLNFKGKKIAAQSLQLAKEGSFEIMMRFEHLRSLF